MWGFNPDPTATEHAEEVNSRVRGRDREDSADAGAPLHKLLQTPSDLRWENIISKSDLRLENISYQLCRV